MTRQNSRLRQLMLTTALSGLALFGYGRGAYAGGCAGGPDTYTCSGAANSVTDTTIYLGGSPLSVTVSSSFGVDTSVNGGDAFNLYGLYGLGFTAATAPISITGYSDGIDAFSLSGPLSITTSGGPVTGVYGNGIYAFKVGYSYSSNLSVTTADVTGGMSGVEAVSYSYGYTGSNLTINTTGGTVAGYSGYGVGAFNLGYAVFGNSGLSITTAGVTGTADGIRALNYGTAVYGSSDLTIDSSAGAVTGTAGFGILADNDGYAGDGSSNLSVTTADVTGGTRGIYARNNGYGWYGSSLTIDSSAGAVTGYGNDGIRAINDGYAGYGYSNLTVTTGTVTGNSDGIHAVNNGYGYYDSTLLVNMTSGTATGTNGEGIYAINNGDSYGYSSNLIVIGRTVTGASDGIHAVNNGSGFYDSNLTIDSSLGAVTGGADGIYAFNDGTGGWGDSNLSVTTADVTGGTNGIWAWNDGYGFYGSSLTIDSSAGTVAGGTGFDGIRAINYGDSRNGYSDLSVTTADVTGGTWGINALNYGDGDEGSSLTIDSSAGAVTGGTGFDGIRAINDGDAWDGSSDLSVTTADVDGGIRGIYAFNTGFTFWGSSNLTIDSSAGAVTGTASDGIWAFNDGTSGYSYSNLSVTTAAVTGATRGIYARNNGDGYYGASLTIDSLAGAVIGASDGIWAYNDGAATSSFSNLSVTTAAVTGGTNGIYAFNTGSGYRGSNLTIDSLAGTVTGGTGFDGIYAYNDGYALDGDSNLIVTTAGVSGGTNGIFVTNNGTSYSYSSNLTIVSTAGSVTGTAFNSNGIRAVNNGDAVDGTSNLSVTTANVTGGTYGIWATNNGDSYYDSNLTIDSSAGAVTGTAGDGIFAINNGDSYYGASNLIVTAADVTGGTNGIYAVNDSYGYTDSSLAVTATGGAVTGTAGYGISAVNNGGGRTDIDVVNYASVQGGAAGITVTHSSWSYFTIDVDGYSSVSNLSGATTDLAINAESAFEGLTLTIDSTSSLTGTVDLTDQDDTFNNGGLWNTSGGTNDFGGGYDVLNNTSSLTIVVGDGSPNQNTYFDNLDLFANDGTVDFADGYASDTLTLSGNFDGNNGTPGVLQMDVYMGGGGSDADLFVIEGDVISGPTDIELFSVGGAGAFTGWGQDDGIALVDVSNTGNTADGDFQISQAVWADLIYYGDIVLGTDFIWRLQSGYLPTIPAYEVYTSALLDMTQLPTYRERRGTTAASKSLDGGTEIWLRLGGKRRERGQEGSTTETSFEQTHFEAVVGADFQIADEFTLGANVRYASGSADVTSPHGNPSIDTSGFGFGATVTWQMSGATYVDAQAQYMFYDSDLGERESATSSASGYAVSVEAGHRIPVSANWSVVPRGQLSYTAVDFDDITGPYGETARLTNGESMIASAGASLDREWIGPGGTLNSFYGSLDVSYEFEPETAAEVSSVSTIRLERAADPTRVELGVGGTFGLSERVSIYGSLTASEGVDDFGGSGDLAASIGVNFKW